MVTRFWGIPTVDFLTSINYKIGQTQSTVSCVLDEFSERKLVTESALTNAAIVVGLEGLLGGEFQSIKLIFCVLHYCRR